jgi:hypothetical protein
MTLSLSDKASSVMQEKQETTLQDRVIEWAKEVRDQADALPPGPDRDMLLKKVRQAETAVDLIPGLQPPPK